MFASTSKYRLDFNSLLSILFTHFLFIRLELPKVDVDFMGTNVLNLFSTNLIKDCCFYYKKYTSSQKV